MSGGPVGAESDIEITKKYHKFVRIGLNPKTWCEYEGGPKACGLDSLATERDYACLYCQYRKPVNVPNRIEFALREKG